MNKIALTTLALVLATGLAAAQTQEQDHKAHHPEGAASAPNAKAPATAADMAATMKTMQDMHQKMMAAKTPAERQALMDEHMQAMQGGMGMMKKQMAGKGGTAAGMKAMEQRMDMMQMMMEMMMDRMPSAAMPGSK